MKDAAQADAFLPVESLWRDLALGQLAVQHSCSWPHSPKALAGQLSYSQKGRTVVVELVAGI